MHTVFFFMALNILTKYLLHLPQAALQVNLAELETKSSGRTGQVEELKANQIRDAAPLRPRVTRPLVTPIPEGNSILGVIYGVLLWADMNAATPLMARWRSVITLARPPPKPCSWHNRSLMASRRASKLCTRR